RDAWERWPCWPGHIRAPVRALRAAIVPIALRRAHLCRWRSPDLRAAMRAEASRPSSHQPQATVAGHQRFNAIAADDDHILDLQARPAELVVGRLDAHHHALLDDVLARRRQVREVISIDADAVADMRA